MREATRLLAVHMYFVYVVILVEYWLVELRVGLQGVVFEGASHELVLHIYRILGCHRVLVGSYEDRFLCLIQVLLLTHKCISSVDSQEGCWVLDLRTVGECAGGARSWNNLVRVSCN